MTNNEPIVYYSTNVKIAHFINETYYKGLHYVWATPVFDAETLSDTDVNSSIPPSSNPCQIYYNLINDIKKSDKHSLKIKELKLGIKRGASIKKKQGVITDVELIGIRKLVNNASFDEFQPYVYVIPYEKIQSKLKPVPVDKKASPLSVEFQIEDLKSDEFDVICPRAK